MWISLGALRAVAFLPHRQLLLQSQPVHQLLHGQTLDDDGEDDDRIGRGQDRGLDGKTLTLVKHPRAKIEYSKIAKIEGE